jgi:UDP-glucose 4-epimerase
MNVLVTGGTGAIGAFVTRFITSCGHRPVVPSRHGPSPLQPWLSEGAELVQGDLATIDVRELIRSHGIQRVVHLAAEVGEQLETDIRRGVDVNASMTLRLLEAAAGNGVDRFVLMSSKAVYGDIKGEHGDPLYVPLEEDGLPSRPVSAYAASKQLSETYARIYGHRGTFHVVAIRAATTVGPGRGGSDGIVGVLSKIVEGAIRGERVTLAGGASLRDDFVYTKDVARGLALACLAEPAPSSPVFHISTGRATSLGELRGALLERYPHASLEIGTGDRLFDVDHSWHCVLSYARARDEIGYEPKWPFPAWLDDYADELAEIERTC